MPFWHGSTCIFISFASIQINMKRQPRLFVKVSASHAFLTDLLKQMRDEGKDLFTLRTGYIN